MAVSNDAVERWVNGRQQRREHAENFTQAQYGSFMGRRRGFDVEQPL